MTTIQPVPAATGNAAEMRANLAVERLLNAWLRERMIGFTPNEGEDCVLLVGADRLHAACLSSSPGGFHRWRLPLKVEGSDGTIAVINDASALAGLMAGVLVMDNGDAAKAAKARLLMAVRGSENHALSLMARPTNISPLRLEQSLWHGHPFHPFAKSIDGFSPEDIERYAPERASSFQLRWILADPHIGGTLWRDARAEVRIRNLLAGLSGLPEDMIGERLLIPCHPWQAERLQQNPAFTQLVKEECAVITPPVGKVMHPTSSVRTLFAPEANIFLKLPIAARITNFARTNPRDQIARGMAAGRALTAVSEQVSACDLDTLDEPGAIWIDRPGLEAITGVILRNGPEREAYVLAGLLEPRPDDGRPMLAAMGHAPCDYAEAEAWLCAYVRTVVLPPLRLFASTGISLEAHSQNSLLVLAEGKPARLIVRDLEGVSVDRDRFDTVAPGLDLDPALFFPAEKARQRLAYYAVGNQLNHVVATIARLTDMPEIRLWSVVAAELAAATEDEQTAGLVTWLLRSETLPAKANFTSCFAGRGERPDYVAIPNPLWLAAHAETSRTAVSSWRC